MKNLICIVLIFNLCSCISKKQTNTNLEKVQLTEIKKEVNLSKDEYDLVNDLLDAQFTSGRYKNEQYIDKVLIQDSGDYWWSLQGYEFCLKFKQECHLQKENTPIDSIQLKKLKIKLTQEKPYNWKTKDIKNYKVKLMTAYDFANSIKKAEYIGRPEKLILYISKPYILNENFGFVYFNSGASNTGFTNIERIYVSMKKENGKWVKNNYYQDGIVH